MPVVIRPARRTQGGGPRRGPPPCAAMGYRFQVMESSTAVNAVTPASLPLVMLKV